MTNLKSLQLFNEPNTAAISYGHDNGIQTGYILDFDYSWGTLDVSKASAPKVTRHFFFIALEMSV